MVLLVVNFIKCRHMITMNVRDFILNSNKLEDCTLALRYILLEKLFLSYPVDCSQAFDSLSIKSGSVTMVTPEF